MSRELQILNKLMASEKMRDKFKLLEDLDNEYSIYYAIQDMLKLRRIKVTELEARGIFELYLLNYA